ncbi:MAG: ABC transporter permease [Alphaproteobacteria bacterium]|jgi:ABC-2 type transport system permease protein|nr:ABC transporter permease [Alphaproteobacteria bacterium]
MALDKFAFSIPRFWAILIKEFIQMWRDRGTFAMMVFLPIMQLCLFGFALNSDPKLLPAGLLNYDNSPFSRTLLKSLENSEYFKFTHILNNETQAQTLLDTGDIQFVVNIPENFARKLQRGERPAVLIQADATDPTAMANALAAASALNPTVLDRDLVGPLQPLKGKLAPFEMRVHRLYNPEAITQYNIVPGLIGTILTLTMVVMTSVAVTREKERGTMENLLSTPVRPIEVMLGKILPFIIVGYIQVVVILASSKFFFSVPIMGSLLLLTFVTIFFITANLSIGFTFSTIASNQLQASQMSTFFFLPSLLLSGFFYPFRGMPDWAQSIGEILPLTHYLRIVRGILLKGNGLYEVWPHLWPIIIFMLGAMTLAMFRYTETLD